MSRVRRTPGTSSVYFVERGVHRPHRFVAAFETDVNRLVLLVDNDQKLSGPHRRARGGFRCETHDAIAGRHSPRRIKHPLQVAAASEALHPSDHFWRRTIGDGLRRQVEAQRVGKFVALLSDLS